MSVEQALYNLGQSLYGGLVASFHQKGRVASGRTINEIQPHVEGKTRMYITGPAYLVQLEKGRGPTSKTGPYPRYGGLTFKESLRLWMEARGIPEGKIPKNGGYGPVLWAIATTIHEKGFAGTPGLVTKPLSSDAINKAIDENLGPLANLYATEVYNELFK